MKTRYQGRTTVRRSLALVLVGVLGVLNYYYTESVVYAAAPFIALLFFALIHKAVPGVTRSDNPEGHGVHTGSSD
jgi:hypothetical protein